MSLINDMLELKIWAVVGATNNKDKFGFKIFKKLLDAGFEVYPVNPGVSEILGHKCYKSLADLSVKPDGVNFVVPPQIGVTIVQECAELGINNIWLQPGANGEQVIALAQKLKMNVVHDACILVEVNKKYC